MVLSDEEHQKRLELYQRGYNDTEIAEEVGVKPCTIWEWREKNDLTANRPAGWLKLSNKEESKRRKLYKKGLCDREMGEKVGVSASAIQRWRQKNGLSPNKLHKAIKLDLTETWELGYFIGLVAGDGTVTKYGRVHSVRFVSTRKDYIDMIEKYAIQLFPDLTPTRCSFYTNPSLPRGRKHRRTLNHAVQLNSKELYHFLAIYKPSNYYWLPPSNARISMKKGFVGGIIDSDGNISRPCVRISSKNEESLVHLKKMLKRDLNLIYGKVSVRREGEVYGLFIYGRENHRILLKEAKLPYKRKKLEGYINDSSEHSLTVYSKAIQLKDKGTGYKKASNILGVNQQTVYNWFYKNIKPRCIKLAEQYG